MYRRWFAASVFAVLQQTAVAASGGPTIPFVDGIWHGDIETGSNSSDFRACWASTTFGDGTTLTLAERKDGTWHLQLANPGWRLPVSHRYDMTALVDFYPRLRIVAEAKSRTRLDIADIDRTSLLKFIEIGHTIDLMSDGFTAKYELEGSAKIIERIRNCFADHAA